MWVDDENSVARSGRCWALDVYYLEDKGSSKISQQAVVNFQ